MNKKYPLPDPEKVKQTVAKLRQSRLEMEEFGLELEEITAFIEAHIRQQKIKRYHLNIQNLSEVKFNN